MRNLRLIGIIFSLSLPVFGAQKVAAELQTMTTAGAVDVIVQFNQTPATAQHQLVAQYGGALKGTLPSANAALYSIPAAGISNLAASNQVVYISPNRTVHSMLDVAAAAVTANIAAQYKFNGAGIGIAVIDSGVSPVTDLASRIVYSESFVPGDTSVTDLYGHGTHVSGIAAGSGAMSTGSTFTHTYQGIAPGANIINLKALDSTGTGTDSAIIAAIDRAIQLQSRYNIRVINLSVARPVYESFSIDPLCRAVENAWANGIVVVVAAGNYGRNDYVGNKGYATITAPGNDPAVITVGAMKTAGTLSTADDLIATYSSKGPTLGDHIVKPDLVAPGNLIASAEAPGSALAQETGAAISYSAYRVDGSPAMSADYIRLSGTSMATPVVSGAVALLLQQNPNLTPDQVKARLMKTARKEFARVSFYTDPTAGSTYVDQSDIFTVGAGYLDVWAALQNNDLAKGPAFSPIAVQAADGGIYLADSAPAVWAANGTVSSAQVAVGSVWGGSTIWSAGAVWGSSVLVSGTKAAWGGTGLWGSSSAVWGGPNAADLPGGWVWGSSSTVAADSPGGWVWGSSTSATAADSPGGWVWGSSSPVAADSPGGWVWGSYTLNAADSPGGWVWGSNSAIAAGWVWGSGSSTTAADSPGGWVWGSSAPAAADSPGGWVWGSSILTGGEK